MNHTVLLFLIFSRPVAQNEPGVNEHDIAFLDGLSVNLSLQQYPTPFHLSLIPPRL